MNTQNQKNPIKKLANLIGVASAGALLAVPALVIIDSTPSNPSRRLLAQGVPANTQQTPVGAGTTQQTLGSPIPQPQVPPVGAGTTQQTLGNPIPQSQIPPQCRGTTQQLQFFPQCRGTAQQPFRNPILPIPGTGTSQPYTQRSGF